MKYASLKCPHVIATCDSIIQIKYEEIMNIRKLEDLSKDELIKLIKQEREARGQLVPISVEERLPLSNGEAATRWYFDVLVYTALNETFISFYDYEDSGWYNNDGDLIDDVTHWLPIPRLP